MLVISLLASILFGNLGVAFAGSSAAEAGQSRPCGTRIDLDVRIDQVRLEGITKSGTCWRAVLKTPDDTLRSLTVGSRVKVGPGYTDAELILITCKAVVFHYHIDDPTAVPRFQEIVLTPPPGHVPAECR